eukprot:CAMPEP_0182925840 /NCGR_PEP_ID=MMETSP0105_2-20130417/10691_1 /TAXON_ID=81532 ORGANISM="Acanthoeca-like sp., Strain 10tr" /NCGR_SAMPLE_ID=MMETSP0105_2 /ASSEMBLY_ACC=CAM_ASM_000205 /LENGTH=169 /DNA_ID=CAMNT_0025063707 /DNA_START=125 /DNA_END=634 /DNA_ORIENTATION=-
MKTVNADQKLEAATRSVGCRTPICFVERVCLKWRLRRRKTCEVCRADDDGSASILDDGQSSPRHSVNAVSIRDDGHSAPSSPSTPTAEMTDEAATGAAAAGTASGTFHGAVGTKRELGHSTLSQSYPDGGDWWSSLAAADAEMIPLARKVHEEAGRATEIISEVGLPMV